MPVYCQYRNWIAANVDITITDLRQGDTVGNADLAEVELRNCSVSLASQFSTVESASTHGRLRWGCSWHRCRSWPWCRTQCCGKDSRSCSPNRAGWCREQRSGDRGTMRINVRYVSYGSGRRILTAQEGRPLTKASSAGVAWATEARTKAAMTAVNFMLME